MEEASKKIQNTWKKYKKKKTMKELTQIDLEAFLTEPEDKINLYKKLAKEDRKEINWKLENKEIKRFFRTTLLLYGLVEHRKEVKTDNTQAIPENIKHESSEPDYYYKVLEPFFIHKNLTDGEAKAIKFSTLENQIELIKYKEDFTKDIKEEIEKLIDDAIKRYSEEIREEEGLKGLTEFIPVEIIDYQEYDPWNNVGKEEHYWSKIELNGSNYWSGYPEEKYQDLQKIINKEFHEDKKLKFQALQKLDFTMINGLIALFIATNISNHFMYHIYIMTQKKV